MLSVMKTPFELYDNSALFFLVMLTGSKFIMEKA